MPRTVQQSGAQKRKASKQKLEKDAILLAKTPRLSQFFSSEPVTTTSPRLEVISASTEHNCVLFDSAETVDDLEDGPSTSTPTVDGIEAGPSITTETIDEREVGPSTTTEKMCSDPATWFPLTEKRVTALVKLTVNQNRNDADTYPESQRTYQSADGSIKRYFKNSMFYTRHDNGEQRLRKWLIYSPLKGCAYCFYCTLMTTDRDAFSREVGFNNWRKSEEKMKIHEQGQAHRESVLKYNLRCAESSHVDKELEAQINENRKYWREILRRTIAVVIFLAERGLPFRGKDENIGSKHNGNFLGIIELIAQFDPLLKSHIENYGNPGSGRESYLSSTVYEEVVLLMAKKVQNVIITELKAAKYFSVSVDSTPDLTHTDQLTVIVRYVVSGRPVERFLTFLQPSSHKSGDLSTTLLDFLELKKIDFDNCRGQSYDNASNMAGSYSGMQARLLQKNSLAVFVPCAAHSLNLVGHAAVSCCVEAVGFFGFVQKLYTFLSASTWRWNVFEEFIKNNNRKLTVKSLSDTRWSARADAAEALLEGYDSIRQALRHIAAANDQTPTTRYDARSLSGKMDLLETALMTKIWCRILLRFNETNKAIQGVDVDLKKAVELYDSLALFLQGERSRFDELEGEAIALCNTAEYRPTKGRPRKNQEETPSTFKENFKRLTFDVILDELEQALQKRRAAYQTVYERFRGIIELCRLSEAELRLEAEKLVAVYPQDLTSLLGDELVQFAGFAKIRACQTPSQQAVLLYDEDLADTFPNVYNSLRLYLCLMITNCSGERSFSKLALIKNKLRSMMGDERLSSLCILSIESDILKSINFEELIKEFAEAKCRRQSFL